MTRKLLPLILILSISQAYAASPVSDNVELENGVQIINLRAQVWSTALPDINSVSEAVLLYVDTHDAYVYAGPTQWVTVASGQSLPSGSLDDLLTNNGSNWITTDQPKVDKIRLDITAEESAAVGEFTWSDQEGMPEVGLEDGTVIRIPESRVLHVRNVSGNTLTKGQVVTPEGTVGQVTSVTPAIATDGGDPIGLIASDILDNATGYVVTGGIIDGVDTSSFSMGDELYLSTTTAGELQNTLPDAPNHRDRIGLVQYDHPSQGQIIVNIQLDWDLNQLGDSVSTTPNDNDVWTFDNATGLWGPEAAASGGGGSFQVLVASANASATEIAAAEYLCDGVNDEVEIQSALDSAGVAFRGGVVHLSGGEFYIGSRIALATSYLKLYGQGKYITTLVRDYNSASLQDNGVLCIAETASADLNNIEIGHLAINGNRSTYTSGNNNNIDSDGNHSAYNLHLHDLYLYDAAARGVLLLDQPGADSRGRYERLHISNCGNEGLYLNADQEAKILDCNIVDNAIHNLYMENCHYSIVSNNRLEQVSGSVQGIDINESDYCDIVGNISIGHTNNYTMNSGSIRNTIVGNIGVNASGNSFGILGDNNTVTGNNDYNAAGAAYFVPGDDNELSGNNCLSPNKGFYLSGNNNTVNGGTVDTAVAWGWELDSGRNFINGVTNIDSQGAYASLVNGSADNSVIKNCIFKEVPTYGIAFAGGAHNVHIINNTFIDTVSSTSAIWLNGTVNNLLLSGNILDGAGMTSLLTDGGSNTVTYLNQFDYESTEDLFRVSEGGENMHTVISSATGPVPSSAMGLRQIEMSLNESSSFVQFKIKDSAGNIHWASMDY